METQRIRIGTDPDTENSKDDALHGKGVDSRNQKTSLSGTRKKGENVSEVNSNWIIQDPTDCIRILYLSNYRGYD